MHQHWGLQPRELHNLALLLPAGNQTATAISVTMAESLPTPKRVKTMGPSLALATLWVHAFTLAGRKYFSRKYILLALCLRMLHERTAFAGHQCPHNKLDFVP
jgi:hypothetical protein